MSFKHNKQNWLLRELPQKPPDKREATSEDTSLEK